MIGRDVLRPVLEVELLERPDELGRAAGVEGRATDGRLVEGLVRVRVVGRVVERVGRVVVVRDGRVVVRVGRVVVVRDGRVVVRVGRVVVVRDGRVVVRVGRAVGRDCGREDCVRLRDWLDLDGAALDEDLD